MHTALSLSKSPRPLNLLLTLASAFDLPFADYCLYIDFAPRQSQTICELWPGVGTVEPTGYFISSRIRYAPTIVAVIFQSNTKMKVKR